ncbi:MAG TPA: PExPT-CTERM protein [Edaphobacter sp.]|jgi:XrtJ-associated TM-motif-TM protein|nr:PExPT-CTERM protein [Edaphobacter sp.]
MKNFRFLILGFTLLVLSAALPLHAQGGEVGTPDGCVESPENPTAILALLGSAGAFCVSARARIKARCDPK